MSTEEDVRRFALNLPETTEKPAWGMPTFRVKDKIFASIGDEEGVLGFAIDKTERAGLIASDPKTYFVKAGHDDNYNFARARLERLDAAELAEVLTDAWGFKAGSRLREELQRGESE